MAYILILIANSLLGHLFFFWFDLYDDFWDLWKVNKEKSGDVFGLKRNKDKLFRWNVENVLQYSLVVFFLSTVITLLTSLWIVLSIVMIIGQISRYYRNSKSRQNKNKSLKIDQYRKSQYKGFDPPKPNIITIKKAINEGNPLPFELSTDQVIYLEDQYNEPINNFIKEHHKEITSWFKNMAKGNNSYEFIYVPKCELLHGDRFLLEDFIKFNLPGINEEDIKVLGKSAISTADISKVLLEYIGYSGEIYPGFFRIQNNASNSFENINCSYYKLPKGDKDTLYKAIWAYLDNIGHRRASVAYQRRSLKSYYQDKGQTYELADVKFNYESSKIALEVRKKISELSVKGFEQVILSELLKKLPGYKIVESKQDDLQLIRPKLSRLRIDEDFKIWLTDFENMEVKLTPLPKAIFFLFLRHDEGILLKHICDHEEELMEIYKVLSYRESYENMIQSIKDVVDPTKNSINEKASRIKEAFVKLFSDDIARNYYLVGDRGKEKRITLERSLVSWECSQIHWPYKKSKSFAESETLNERIKQLNNEGLKLQSKGEYHKAILQYSKLIDLYGFDYNAYINRGLCYLNIHEYEKAEKDNEFAATLYEGVGIHTHNRSEARLMLKKYDQALEDINSFLKKYDNKCAESYFIRGLIHMEKGMIDIARQDWYNAQSLGNESAFAYLKEYPGKRISKVRLENKSSN